MENQNTAPNSLNDLISVREMKESDIQHIVDYWMNAKPDYLEGMGADINKMPPASSFFNMLYQQLKTPLTKRKAYVLIWELDTKPVGHCNLNPVQFGNEANMHLHIWSSGHRKRGIGVELVKQSIPYFFHNFHLKVLFCEPYALNPAPNKTLEKVGFTYVKEYSTIPGSINFEQLVKRWQLTKQDFQELYGIES